MSNVAIRVENLSKLYHIGHAQQRHDTLRDALVASARNLAPKFQNRVDSLQGTESEIQNPDVVWALRDVSFEVKRGEVLGIIGRNGAGKSTLLKVLSRITEPTEGRAEIHGRIGSLLEVGTGFHPELTGRENIYLNGAILGMKRAEIKRCFDKIVAFAEIDRFLDTPVKRYSSGMYVRLAFAVAAHLEPEVLVVDEVLAVGDAVFQRKCLGKMEDVAKEGRTVLFVSHSMAAIQSLCSRTLLLGNGEILADSDSMAVIRQYCSQAQVGSGDIDLTLYPRSGGNGKAHIQRLRIIDESFQPTSSVPMGSEIGFEISFRSSAQLDRAEFVIGIYDSLMHRVCQFSSSKSGFYLGRTAYEGVLRCRVQHLAFVAGSYYVSLGIMGPGRQETYDHLTQAATFDVTEADVFGTGAMPDPLGGPCFFEAKWNTQPDAVSQ